jgi:hypothetical protein
LPENQGRRLPLSPKVLEVIPDSHLDAGCGRSFKKHTSEAGLGNEGGWEPQTIASRREGRSWLKFSKATDETRTQILQEKHLITFFYFTLLILSYLEQELNF